MPSPLPLPFARRSRNQDICVDALIGALKGRGWRLRASIARDLGVSIRTVRALASASEGRVLSGQKGLCLVEEATVEDTAHAANALEAQGRALIQHAEQIRRVSHRRIA
jgi:D-alanyl-D-alanine dipeptidase